MVGSELQPAPAADDRVSSGDHTSGPLSEWSVGEEGEGRSSEGVIEPSVAFPDHRLASEGEAHEGAAYGGHRTTELEGTPGPISGRVA